MYGNGKVSKETILNLITEYDIFKKYVNNFKEVNKKFVSELRQDQHPTCVIGRVGNTLKYRDFSEFEAIDCFEYIKRKYVVNFGEALEMVNRDFNLGLLQGISINYVPTPSIIHGIDIESFPKLSTVIQIQRRQWSLGDKAYWNGKYGFTSKELDKAHIMPIAGFWVNGVYIKADPIAYAYYFGEGDDGRSMYKIYQPYSKTLKWLTNCSQDLLQGEELLPDTGDLLIITKSYKDVMVLFKLGIAAIAPQGETVNISEEKIEELSRRFTNIILLYDNDTAGVNAIAKLVEETNLPHFFLPSGTKDVSDFVELYSYESLLTFLNEQINLLCHDSSMGE